MALLSRDDLLAALVRLGQLASADDASLDLIVVGGGVMVLEFAARFGTRDLDVVVSTGAEPAAIRKYAAVVATEFGWPADWLNDGAKGFLVGPVVPRVILEIAGIRVSRPPIEQLLAMKLCAWRDDIDIADAARLLAELPQDATAAWALVEPFLQPGRELKAYYAFQDLWEDRP